MSMHRLLFKTGLISALLLLFLSSPCLAQTSWLKGKVLDSETKQAIPEVYISFPEINKGTTTDSTGEFRIKM
jgi:hypothetical protein